MVRLQLLSKEVVITMDEDLKDLMFPEGQPEPDEFIIALTEVVRQINELRK